MNFMKKNKRAVSAGRYEKKPWMKKMVKEDEKDERRALV